MLEDSGEKAQLNLDHIVRWARTKAEDDARPGLLLLHGRGADEYDLMGLEEGLDPRLTIVSARAPLSLGRGFMWYDLSHLGEPDAMTMQSSLEQLRLFIKSVPGAYHIDPERIYLMGFSQGAIMSAALALTDSVSVRGVIMHSGYVPVDYLMGVDPAGLRDKPFFVAHGKYDDILPVTLGRDAAEYLAEHKARLTYQEYPIGHTISEESFYDLSEWLTAQLDE